MAWFAMMREREVVALALGLGLVSSCSELPPRGGHVVVTESIDADEIALEATFVDAPLDALLSLDAFGFRASQLSSPPWWRLPQSFRA